MQVGDVIAEPGNRMARPAHREDETGDEAAVIDSRSRGLRKVGSRRRPQIHDDAAMPLYGAAAAGAVRGVTHHVSGRVDGESLTIGSAGKRVERGYRALLPDE